MYSNNNFASRFEQGATPKPTGNAAYGTPGRPMGNPAIFGAPAVSNSGPVSSANYGTPGRPMGNPAIFGGQATNNGSSSSNYGANRPAGGNPAIFGGSAAAGPPSGGSLREISMSELRQHSSGNSLWIGFKGHVYDATGYVHSGGSQALSRGAGKDATQMIQRQHAWVKVDEVLKSKRVGILIPEDDSDSD